MEILLNNFDFLKTLAKSNIRNFPKIINNATDEELKALSICLSLSKQVTHPRNIKPVKLKKRENIKAFRKFAASKAKLILPIVTCVLSKLIQDLFYYICDNV